ncbi:MAG: VWA domain-containing protein, partial [Polyangiaceae bacterium]|nr:VWA domain-containing protein [Polyangiaceae bacterium]
MVRRWMWAGLVTTALGAGCGEGAPANNEQTAVLGGPPRTTSMDGAAKEKTAASAAAATAEPQAAADGLFGPGSGEQGRAGVKQEEKAAAPTRDRYGVPGPRESAPADKPAPAKKIDADHGGKVAANMPAAPPPPPTATSQTSPQTAARPVAAGGAQPAAVVTEEAAIDPNGRFATTYRPGGGHLSAFESAVAAGIVPTSEKEIVSDIGARYTPAIDPPKEGALAIAVDFERSKLAPSGGPVHVRLALRSSTEKATERPPLSVVVVMDVSGSMRGQLIQAARNAASDLVDKLDAKDDFSLVTFSTGAEVKIPMGKVGSRREELKKSIAAIAEGGGTNIGEGLRLGYQQANDKAASKDGVRVVFLMSDGRANEGITARPQLSRLALDAFQGGIQTS